MARRAGLGVTKWGNFVVRASPACEAVGTSRRAMGSYMLRHRLRDDEGPPYRSNEVNPPGNPWDHARAAISRWPRL